MEASHDLTRISTSFDESHLVAHAGLLAPAVLVQRIGLAELVTDTLSLPESVGANSAAKLTTVLAGMLAGADSIDDLDVLRSGATPRLFDDLRAPLDGGQLAAGIHLLHVRQLDALGRLLRTRLWAVGAGPKQLAGPLIVDLDSTICPTYGPAKSGTAFGYTKVRGYHPLLATVREPGQAGEVLHTRLRRGNAGLRPGRRALPHRGAGPGSVRRGQRPAAGARRCRLLRPLCGAGLPAHRRPILESTGQSWAAKLAGTLERLNVAVHQARDAGRDRLDPDLLAGLHARYDAIVAQGWAANPEPPGGFGRKRPVAVNLLDRLTVHRADYLRFSVDFGVPFTNNTAEQDIRPVKIRAKISGCRAP
jgi:hypothetical protein